MPETHSILRCEHEPSPGLAAVKILAILPGEWTIIRKMKPTEKATNGHGSLKCDGQGGCGARWLVIQREEAAA